MPQPAGSSKKKKRKRDFDDDVDVGPNGKPLKVRMDQSHCFIFSFQPIKKFSAAIFECFDKPKYRLSLVFEENTSTF